MMQSLTGVGGMDHMIDRARALTERHAVHGSVHPKTRALFAVPKAPKAKVASRRLALVRRAEAFMWENVSEPLTLDSICAAVHCNARTLIYAFKERFGVGPMTHFKVRRLQAVREKLQAPGQEKVRIFDIAADFGFWHEGHFSADFKAMFGMTPSQTREAARSEQ